MITYKLETWEIFLLLAGVGILTALPFISGVGIWIWIFAKLTYFTGVALYIKSCSV